MQGRSQRRNAISIATSDGISVSYSNASGDGNFSTSLTSPPIFPAKIRFIAKATTESVVNGDGIMKVCRHVLSDADNRFLSLIPSLKSKFHRCLILFRRLLRLYLDFFCSDHHRLCSSLRQIANTSLSYVIVGEGTMKWFITTPNMFFVSTMYVL